MQIETLDIEQVEEYCEPLTGESKLWNAVVEQAVQDWAGGSQRYHNDAEKFIFHDDDFHVVCQQAGLDASNIRARLTRFMPQIRSRYA